MKNSYEENKDEIHGDGYDGDMQVSEAMRAYKGAGSYTYSDYVEWDIPENEKWELIDGKPYLMASANINHNDVQIEIVVQLYNYLRGKKCKVYTDVDTRLNLDTLDNTVVRPDVLVVCDKTKTSDRKAVAGAPDFAVEILSPSNPKHDKVTKFKKYLEAGVREYWIVDPMTKTVAVNLLTDGEYSTQIHGEDAKVSSSALSGCVIDFEQVFSDVP